MDEDRPIRVARTIPWLKEVVRRVDDVDILRRLSAIDEILHLLDKDSTAFHATCVMENLSLDPLFRAANSTDPALKCSAFRCLRRLADNQDTEEWFVGTFLSGLSSENGEIREEAALGLAGLCVKPEQQDEVISKLTPLVENHVSGVRRAAAFAIGMQIEERSSRTHAAPDFAPITSALNSASPEVVVDAALALFDLGRNGVELRELRELLERNLPKLDSESRVEVEEVLEEIKDMD